MEEIIIIGAGASGMFSAIKLKEKGIRVTVLEKNAEALKKIYATGNGRCNITNTSIDVKNYFGQNPKFAYSSIKNFTHTDSVKFFGDIGMMITSLQDGRSYPMSYEAKTVVEFLSMRAKELGVNIIFNTEVKEISFDEYFTLKTSNGDFFSEKLVIATGGKAYSKSGSTGDGFKFAKKFGHSIEYLYPGGVQLKTKEIFKNAQGVRILGDVKLISNGKTLRRETGDIIIADYGITGSAVFQISANALKLLKDTGKSIVEVDFLKDFTFEELKEKILKLISEFPKRSIESLLKGFINHKLITYILKYSNIDKNKKSGEISKTENEKLIKNLKGFPFTVLGAKDKENGQFTCGGVSTFEVDNKTMESLIVKGLYFIGEVLDITGDCGGYNLHWAFASANSLSVNLEGKRCSG